MTTGLSVHVATWSGSKTGVRALVRPVGNYDFQTTVDFTGFRAGSAALAGFFASDNELRRGYGF